MMKMPVSGNERAVLVHHVAAMSRCISGEGTPSRKVERAAGIPFTEWAQYTIFFPDHGAEEFTGFISRRST